MRQKIENTRLIIEHTAEKIGIVESRLCEWSREECGYAICASPRANFMKFVANMGFEIRFCVLFHAASVKKAINFAAIGARICDVAGHEVYY